MKFFELANEFEARPEVYVDMDGVLADMFGEIARHHGVKNWRDARRDRKRAGDKIDKIAKRPGFFQHLKPLPNAGKLIRNVMALRGEYNILSSPMLSNVEQSTREKAEWLQHHLKRNTPGAVLFDHEKFKFAKQADGTPNILIDDYDTNIHLWEANGGIGILYRDSQCNRALRQLQAALHGRFKRTYHLPLAILQREIEQGLDESHAIDLDKKFYTNREILQYVKGVHDGFHIDNTILDHKVWVLRNVPLHDLSSPEKFDQDDRYRRVIDLDWDHIADITRQDILNRPCVADEQGWVLDGNHRVTAARAANMQSVPCFVPYNR
jgi:5'(3')-deoxyribonucleotidase